MGATTLGSLKIVTGKVSWSDRTEWVFPEADKNRLDGSFRKGPNDIDDAVPWLQKYCGEMRSCVQAGGAVGLWPTRLSQLFNRVVSFEAHPVNYQCLIANTEGIKNLTCFNQALSAEIGQDVSMYLDPGEMGNSGAYYIKPGGTIKTTTIDSLLIDDLDLIYLDIEGAETDALKGAKNSIDKCRPVIGIEDKKTPYYNRFGYTRSPVRMLEEWGYVEVARVHLDVIMVPIESYNLLQ